jgi:O-acetyl-ADP-ribose deacetylase (regulator of RNase III)
MLYKEINGSIFDVGAQVIVHQVNCMGVMGSGVAKQVRDRFPSVFIAYHHAVKTLDHNCLGGCLVVEAKENTGLRIANLFGQYYYRGFKEDDLYLVDEFWKQPEIDKQTVKAIRFTNYEAFWKGLIRLKEELRDDETKIAFPYKIGSDRGGADWEVLKEMIKSVFKDTNKEIIICKI